MFTEKHILQNPYNNHKLSRTLSGFDVTTVDCTADKSSGWNGATVNLTPNAVADTQKFSGWSATGTTITNSSFNFAGSDVTAKANFETAKDITLQTDGNGAISADKSYGFVGDIVTLSNTASADYEFTGYSITGATLTGNQFTIENENVTAIAGFSTIETGTPFEFSGRLLSNLYGYGLTSLWYNSTVQSSNLLTSMNIVTGSDMSQTVKFYTYAPKKYRIIEPYFEINITNSGAIPTASTVGYDNENTYSNNIFTTGTGTNQVIYSPNIIEKTAPGFSLIPYPGVYFAPNTTSYTGTGTIYFSGLYVG